MNRNVTNVYWHEDIVVLIFSFTFVCPLNGVMKCTLLIYVAVVICYCINQK